MFRYVWKPSSKHGYSQKCTFDLKVKTFDCSSWLVIILLCDILKLLLHSFHPFFKKKSFSSFYFLKAATSHEQMSEWTAQSTLPLVFFGHGGTAVESGRRRCSRNHRGCGSNPSGLQLPLLWTQRVAAVWGMLPLNVVSWSQQNCVATFVSRIRKKNK